MPQAQSESAAQWYQRTKLASQELPVAELAAAHAWGVLQAAAGALEECRSEFTARTGFGPSTWWPRATGRLHQSQADAREALRRAEVQFSRTQTEHAAAAARVQRLQADADDIHSARQVLIDTASTETAEQVQTGLAEVREITEALAMVDRARDAAHRVDAQLHDAKSWSTYDTFLGGDMVASLMKQDAIHSADDASVPLVEALNSLRVQLQDIGAPTAYFSAHTNDLVGWMDVWWDNFFSDLTMARRVNDAQDRTERLLVGLDQLAGELGKRRLVAMQLVDELLTRPASEVPE
jgi:hypothetical protein